MIAADKVVKFIGAVCVFIYWMIAIFAVFIFKQKYSMHEVTTSFYFSVMESNFLLVFGWLSIFSFLIFILNKIFVKANVLGFVIYFAYFLIVYCEFAVNSVCHCFS